MVANLEFTLKRRGRVVRPEDLFRGLDRSFGKHLFKNLRQSFIRDGNEFTGELVSTAPVRTGQLRRSVKSKVTGTRMDGLALRVASDGHPGALVQEHGARITPKRSKFLTIPGPDVMTAAGVARTNFRSWMDQNRGRVAVVNSKRTPGNKVVFGLTPKSRKFRRKIAWVLSKGVTIPGPDTTGTKSNFGFMDTWDRFEDARLQRGVRAIVQSIHDTMIEGKR